MQSSHTHTRRFTPVFDEDHLVSAGGLPAVMGLAERAGFTGLLKARLTVASPNAPVKVRALVSGMLAGADDIDGMDVLRSGGTAKVLGQVRAPSTLGTHLRSFTHGHTLQLGAINRDLQANLAHLVPTLFGSDELVMVDLDAPPHAGGAPTFARCTGTRSKRWRMGTTMSRVSMPWLPPSAPTTLRPSSLAPNCVAAT